MLALFLIAVCLPVAGDRLTARDVAAAVPAFAALPAETPLAWTPAPGLERVAEPAEVARWARQHHLALETAAPRLCFTRQVEPLAQDRIAAALRQAAPGWHFTILETPKAGLPAGDLRFDARALPRPPRSGQLTALIWRGRLQTPSGRRFPIWARVLVWVERPALETTRAIAAGAPLSPGDLTLVQRREHPLWPPPLADASAVTQQRARRSLPAGHAVLPTDLAPRPAIERGGDVTLELSAGAARLQLQARAETSAHTGHVVLLKNPLNGRRFPARVTGAGRAEALLETNPQQSNSTK